MKVFDAIWYDLLGAQNSISPLSSDENAQGARSAVQRLSEASQVTICSKFPLLLPFSGAHGAPYPIDTYSHVLPGMQDEAANKLGSMLTLQKSSVQPRAIN